MCETISILHYSTLTGTIEDDMWIIDSGASRHMTGDLLEYRWCAHFTIDDTLVTQPQAKASL